jgi:AAA lid domain
VINVLPQLAQDKCEPPVYVSDRRFMKSINMLQVAAFADGRSQVMLQCQCLLAKDNSDHAIITSDAHQALG